LALSLFYSNPKFKPCPDLIKSVRNSRTKYRLLNDVEFFIIEAELGLPGVGVPHLLLAAIQMNGQ
jgi:hypothetical protein